MASLKKLYSFTNKRNIWRLIPSESGYLFIEERDLNTREVYFNCLMTSDGKVVFKNFQLDEKYWIGTEAVYKNKIFFHKFRKPDMPGHRGIYALDISLQKVIWQNEDLIFQFVKDEKVFAYQSTFDGREYFVLNYLTGEIIESLGSDAKQINKLREESLEENFTNKFLFPERKRFDDQTPEFMAVFKDIKDKSKLVAEMNWLRYGDTVFFNYHMVVKEKTYNNYLELFDLSRKKKLLSEMINSNTSNLIPDSFFILDNLLFVLVEKTKLVVYKII